MNSALPVSPSETPPASLRLVKPTTKKTRMPSRYRAARKLRSKQAVVTKKKVRVVRAPKQDFRRNPLHPLMSEFSVGKTKVPGVLHSVVRPAIIAVRKGMSGTVTESKLHQAFRQRTRSSVSAITFKAWLKELGISFQTTTTAKGL